jgi:hypothetical protein
MSFKLVIKVLFILSVILPLVSACNQDTHFEKTKWLEKENLSYPYREVMLDDLVTNYELTGLSYDQLEDMLGQPDSLGDNSNEIVYKIKVEYDFYVDPVYVKNLIFEFNPDSIVTAFRIEEYHRTVIDGAGPIDISMLIQRLYFFSDKLFRSGIS